jgi:hypothetical protein
LSEGFEQQESPQIKKATIICLIGLYFKCPLTFVFLQ